MGDEDNGLLSAVRTRGMNGKDGVLAVIKSWDIRGEDMMNLLRGRLSHFRHRRERRLFDMIDHNHTGFVTLDEIISFREQHEETDDLAGDIPLLNIQPDLTRSLVALYHFDVHLDGHLNFDEFILMQDYLHKVERTLDDDDVICCCIPKSWFKRRRVKKKKKKKGNRVDDDDSGPYTPGKTQRGSEAGEKIITRKVSIQFRV